MEAIDALHALALIQGSYYLITGIWPLIHMPSFLLVTGKKHDLWLVNTVGSLLTVIGLCVMVGGITDGLEPPVFLLAFGSALALTTIESIYVFRKTISPIYLLDGAVEVGFMLFWIAFYF